MFSSIKDALQLSEYQLSELTRLMWHQIEMGDVKITNVILTDSGYLRVIYLEADFPPTKPFCKENEHQFTQRCVDIPQFK